MTDKKLRKLRRSALIELLIEQMEENECLTEEIKTLNQKLHDREITIQNAGSIAEAALLLNDVFLAAENAATQYVDNLARMNARCDEILDNAQQEAVRIIFEAQTQAQQPLPKPVIAGEPEAMVEPEAVEELEAVEEPESEPELEPEEPESKEESALTPPSKEALELRFDEVFAQMRRRNK